MKEIISFFKTDIKIINSYFLFAIILVILLCIGYTSYALFSFTKTSNNIIELTVGKLKKADLNDLIKLADNKNDSGLYTIIHPKDTTLQIGNDKDITEYRYRGASPKNYVTFNNEVWRIIGIFPTDDGTGKIENRIKIIRNESIKSDKWNTSSSNDWINSSLNTYLNETYYNSQAVRPVLYLKSNVKIIGGTGTSDNMYQLSIDIEIKNYPLTDGALTLSKLEDNKDNSGLYKIINAKDTTLQIGTNENTAEYRYRGKDPKNYVKFNNEVWRIIGIFPTDDGTGKIENRIKLIRNESIEKDFWNSGSDVNNWAESALQKKLNSTYLTGLSGEAKLMIDNAKYYLGGYNDYHISSIEMYNYERKVGGSEYYYTYGTYVNPANWIGKIGLMYVSDYGYATENCESKALASGISYSDTTLQKCNDTNWLYNLKTGEWLLTPYSKSNAKVYKLFEEGYIQEYYTKYNSSYYNSQAVRPVLYLKSNVKITGGTGTNANPYTLGL